MSEGENAEGNGEETASPQKKNSGKRKEKIVTVLGQLRGLQRFEIPNVNEKATEVDTFRDMFEETWRRIYDASDLKDSDTWYIPEIKS